ncbi:hypothetical protein L2E82_37450 [Cichorium intybus]|uniref:Uncharacterized protein n=1 Tax=Cichorium intybus TaxID=13427 RepID=A0ACB9ADI0_CICIN|nr:hypothetical protein L2E82_37450 [Cichorium intybus]
MMEKSCNSSYPTAGGRSAAEAPTAAGQCFRDFESEEKEKRRDRDRTRLGYSRGDQFYASYPAVHFIISIGAWRAAKVAVLLYIGGDSQL